MDPSVYAVEAEVEADLAQALRKIYFSISGDVPSLDGWLDRPAGGGLLDTMTDAGVGRLVGISTFSIYDQTAHPRGAVLDETA